MPALTSLSRRDRRYLARQGSPRIARFIDEHLVLEVSAAAVTTATATAVIGKITRVDATAQNCIVTAPDPTLGGTFGLKLVKTASAHTMIVAAHSAELFDLTTAPAATSTVGSLYLWQSDGTNWVLVGKI